MLQILKGRHSPGFTIVEALVAVGGLSLIAVASTKLYSNISQLNAQVSTVASISSIRQRIIETVKNTTAWRNTMAQNNVDCRINPGKDCSAVVAGQVVGLYDSLGTQLTGSRDGGANFVGFNLDGTPCVFAGAGAAGCPFRYELTWRPICTASDCTNPQERVSGRLLYARNLPAVINPYMYGFDLIRGEAANTLNEACATVSGVYDPVTRSCTLPSVGDCPPGQVVANIDPKTMNKQCKPYIIPFTCGPKQVLMGMFADGKPKCVDMLACSGLPLVANSWLAGPPGGDGGGDGGAGADGGGGCDGNDGGCGDGGSGGDGGDGGDGGGGDGGDGGGGDGGDGGDGGN